MNEGTRKIEAIFHAAMDLDSPAEREPYLQEACAGDPELRREVEELLRSAAAAEPVFQTGQNAGRMTEADPAVTLAEKPGDHIGRYKLLEKIGEGGMGVVYMAEQREPVRRNVALKIIKLGMDTRQVVARFEAERQALALMDHPHIAQVLDGGATETGRPYFVMELVQGVRITEFCEANHLSIENRIKLFILVCQAIQSAHQKGIIHRDIKPSNVLVTMHNGAPHPMVIDFGVAKATGQKLTEKTLFTNFATMIGTPAYMSPEQAEMSKLDVDTRSDIYSLGVLLYELLTGTTPFPEERLRSVAYGEMQRIIAEEEPERPSTRLRTKLAAKSKARRAAPIDSDLDWIVMKCLEKDPNLRYETANALAADLGRQLANEPVLARAPSAISRLRKTVRRNQGAFAAAAAVVFALAAGMTLALRQLATKNQALQASLQTHVRLTVANGVHRLDEGNALESLPWFTRALELEAGDLQRERIHRMRIATVMEACPRLVRAFLHEAEVNSACLSPDGAWLATASDDHTARLWSVAQPGAEFKTLPHGGAVDWVEFGPDGRSVATASSDGTARIWRVPESTPVTPPLTHDGVVVLVRFSPSGKMVLTSGADGSTKLWDASTGHKLLEGPNHGGRIRYAEFDKDGQQILTVGDHRGLRVFDVATGWIEGTLDHPAAIHHALFTRDGRHVITAGGDRHIQVWEIKSGRVITRRRAHASAIRYLALSPDGTKIVSSSTDGTARIWSYPSLEELTLPLLHSRTVKKATFSPDGRWIATASLDHSARVWDSSNGHAITPPLRHLGEVVWDVAFDRHGSFLITASHDHTARIYDLTTIADPMLSLHEVAPVRAVDFTPDGRFLVTVSTNIARVYDSYDGEPVSPALLHSQPIQSLNISSDGSRAVTASSDGTAKVWSLPQGKPVCPPLEHSGPVSFCVFSPDGREILSINDRLLQLWDAHTGVKLDTLTSGDGTIHFSAFSADGQLFATGADRTARVWDRRRLATVGKALPHEGRVVHLAFSRNGQRLLTASEDRTTRLWEVHSGIQVLPPLLHTDKLVLAKFAPDEKRILTASVDRTAKLWDASTGELLAQLYCRSRLTSAEFSADGTKVLTSSADRTVRIWDVLTGEPITPPFPHPEEVLSARFSPSGDRVVASDREGTIALWSLPTDTRPPRDLVLFARLFAGKTITPQGSLVTLQGEALGELFNDLRSRYPAQFDFPRHPFARWHQEAAIRCTRAGNISGTLFHLDRLLEIDPSNEALRSERKKVFESSPRAQDALERSPPPR